MGQTGKELHFYPGQKLLLLLRDGKVVMRSEAWAGLIQSPTGEVIPPRPTAEV